MKRLITGLLAFCLIAMCGWNDGSRKPTMYPANGAYNLTPQEYIDLANKTTGRQKDGDYLKIPDWDERAAHTVDVTPSFNITLSENDEGKITRISYHWKNTTEAANTAVFLVGVTINMLTTSEKQAKEVAAQLDMFKAQKRSYETEYDANGSHFYYLSADYGEHNWFSADVIK